MLLETAPMVSRLSVKKNLPFAGLRGRALAIDGNATAGKEGCNDTTGEENFDLNSHKSGKVVLSGFVFVRLEVALVKFLVLS